MNENTISDLAAQLLREEAAEQEQSFHDELSSLGWASPDDVKALRDAIEALHVRDKPRQLSISEHELVDRVVEHVDRHLLKKRSICAKAQQMPHVDEVYVTYETTIDGGVFYEVSDDMPGNRWMKIQYRDLGKLLRDFSGKRIYWVEDEQAPGEINETQHKDRRA